jgi:hypothetical protein
MQDGETLIQDTVLFYFNFKIEFRAGAEVTSKISVTVVHVVWSESSSSEVSVWGAGGGPQQGPGPGMQGAHSSFLCPACILICSSAHGPSGSAGESLRVCHGGQGGPGEGKVAVSRPICKSVLGRRVGIRFTGPPQNPSQCSASDPTRSPPSPGPGSDTMTPSQAPRSRFGARAGVTAGRAQPRAALRRPRVAQA